MKEELTKNVNTDVLAAKLKQGVASKEEYGIALKTINTQLAIDLVTSLDDVRNHVNKLKDVREKLTEKLIEKVKIALECDELDLDTMFGYINQITNSEIKINDIYRQIVQGNRMLFDENSLSEADRTLLRVLTSFVDEEDKQKFLSAIKKYYTERKTDNNDDNIEEANVVE